MLRFVERDVQIVSMIASFRGKARKGLQLLKKSQCFSMCNRLISA